MSEPCPNAKKREIRLHPGSDNHKTKTIYKCDVICNICKGAAMVDDCPDCDGCGLRKGGVQCATCHCYGKVPAAVAVS